MERVVVVVVPTGARLVKIETVEFDTVFPVVGHAAGRILIGE